MDAGLRSRSRAIAQYPSALCLSPIRSKWPRRLLPHLAVDPVYIPAAQLNAGLWGNDTKGEKSVRKIRLLTVLGALCLGIFVTAASAAGPTGSNPPAVDDSSLKAITLTEGGASVLPTTRTVPHWWGSTLDPNNGITYGYNMVGANPYTCSGSGCSTTVDVDITPIVVNVQGHTFDGNSVLPATLASPQFALNDYGSTPAATAAGAFPNLPAFIRGPGGALSQEDAGNQLQLEDATMRAQFDQTGRIELSLDPESACAPDGHDRCATAPGHPDR